MIRNIFFMVCLLVGASAFAQDTATSEKGVFEFETDVIDYGTIEQNADGVRAFKFTNVGNAPIVITKAKGSCGCTVPTKPNGPIMPGESGEIGVKYDTKRIGAFSKTITLTSNASVGLKVIKIKGKVLAPTADSSTGHTGGTE